MRTGVIGVGSMGENHARIFSSMPDVELVGIADINEARVNEIAKKYSTQGYTDYRELLNQDLDAVSVVVPTTMHKQVALSAIEKNVDLLVEKPIGDSLGNAELIITSARQAGVKLMVGHIERFNPAVIKLKEIIDSGKVGKIVSVSTRRVGPYNPRIRDVGIIIDLGVHDIDVISYLYGKKVDEVYSIAGKSIHTFEDHASVLLRYDHELAGIIETNWLTPHKVRNLTAIGLEGVAYLDYIEQTVELHDMGWIRKAKVEKQEPLKLELMHFYDVVRNGVPIRSSGEDGYHALQVAMAAIESYMKGKAIKIESITQ